MIGIIGIVVIFVMVFGGYIAAGGKIGIILYSLPFEMMMIGGAATGSFLIANSGSTVKQALRDIGKVFKGPGWKPQDYRDMLCLLFELIRIARANPVALEEHIEEPHTSALFGRYPRTRLTGVVTSPGWIASLRRRICALGVTMAKRVRRSPFSITAPLMRTRSCGASLSTRPVMTPPRPRRRAGRA